MDLSGVAQDLTSRLNSDAQFRRLFHSDPGAALRSAGLTISGAAEQRIRDGLAANDRNQGFVIPGLPPGIPPTVII